MITKQIQSSIVAACAMALSVSAQQSKTIELAPMTVIGTEEELFVLPGSGVVVTSEEFREQNYTNVNRVLAKVPGVYVREEDGSGNFPNISIRGGDGTRNEKVTIMEDGILQAPAPYASPSAYYSPRAGRMAGVEVLKGSSQIAYGPHTTGGVINFLSTPISEEQAFYSRNTYGSNETLLSHTHWSETVETDAGRIGYLLELYHNESGGFREVDAARKIEGTDSTGFTATEPMFKLSWEPNTDLAQKFEFKYGYSELDADETYVGLSEEDIAADPYRRYAGTRFDNIQSEHHRTYLKYIVQPTDTLKLEVAGYYNDFQRNWYRITSTGGESIHTVLANPTEFSEAFDILRLQAPGELGLRANARDYYSGGVQLQGDWAIVTGAVNHELHFGARWHKDEITRFQRNDSIVVADDLGVTIAAGADGSGGNRLEQAEAISLWIEDEISLGALTLRPGIRYESVDLHNTDYASDDTFTATAVRDGSLSEVIPGIGATYELTEDTAVFAGIYKGISVPGPRSVLEAGIDTEESIGYEVGVRHRDVDAGLQAELVGFLTDFDNLIGAAAGLGQDGESGTNAGEAEVYGIEFLVGKDLAAGQSHSIPVHFSATWTQAELKNALSEGGAEDIWAGGVAGAAMPYTPEWKLATGIGIETEKWGAFLDLSYVSEAFGTADNLSEPGTSSRQGLVDEAFLVDLSGYIQVQEGLRLVGGVQNLFDEGYISSRLPEGPRSGAPRQFYMGFELKF
jgi:Fe(3+) dicitrate transport protein